MPRLPSASIIISTLAVVISLGGAGYSATGGNFLLGKSNTANVKTILAAPVDRSLLIANSSTVAGASALALNVKAGHPPMVVNSATKVANLNADLLDGYDIESIFNRSQEGRWHYIGESGEPVFQNSWRNYDAASNPLWRHAAFRIDSQGTVHLHGMIKSGLKGVTIFTLPTGFCPYYFHTFPVVSGAGFGAIVVTYITASGCSLYLDVGSNAWVSLDGISYKRYDLDITPGPAVTYGAEADASLSPAVIARKPVPNGGLH